MGGKGSNITPALPTSGSDSYGSSMEMMMAMMMANQVANAQLETPTINTLELPYQIEYEDVNWSEQSAALAAKSKADYELAQKRRKGNTATVHTSPLLDEEDVNIIPSILTGK